MDWNDPNYRISQKPTVKVGDRVRFTRYARHQNIPSNRMPPDITGIVTRVDHGVTVLWEGYKTKCHYHPSFICNAKDHPHD